MYIIKTIAMGIDPSVIGALERKYVDFIEVVKSYLDIDTLKLSHLKVDVFYTGEDTEPYLVGIPITSTEDDAFVEKIRNADEKRLARLYQLNILRVVRHIEDIFDKGEYEYPDDKEYLKAFYKLIRETPPKLVVVVHTS